MIVQHYLTPTTLNFESKSFSAHHSAAIFVTSFYNVPFAGKNVIMELNEIAMLQSAGIEWDMVDEHGPPHMRNYVWYVKSHYKYQLNTVTI